jgi:DNA-binding LytR/AlgR family response regulator
MKIKCLIVDDEKPARDLLQQYCSDVPFIEVAGECKNAYETMTLISSANPQLLFLDIKMPKLTGLQLLRSLNNPPFVIITTAFREYAFDGFELDVVDYLKKPFSFERFLKAVMKVKTLIEQKASTETGQNFPISNKNDQFLFIKAENTIHKIELDKLMFVEAMGDYSRFVGTKDKYVIYITMKKTESLLPVNTFVRVHRSYIVSLKHIYRVEGNTIHLPEKEIPVGKHYKEAFRKMLSL